MELHTLGVDGGYTQADVTEVARAFTGWTIENPRVGADFGFEPRLHDDGAKVVLGHAVKAGGGIRDGEQVLDILARHPSTARFISTKLARRFVSDAPPAALVDRLAARFTDTRGDLRAVMALLLTAPEFLAPEAYRANVKTPFEFVVSAVRATSAELSAMRPLIQAGAHARLAGISAPLTREEQAMISRRVFLKSGAFALVSLGCAPSFLARTAFAAGEASRAGRGSSSRFSSVAPLTA